MVAPVAGATALAGRTVDVGLTIIPRELGGKVPTSSNDMPAEGSRGYLALTSFRLT